MLLSRSPLTPRRAPVRLACFRHAASVYPEPGSNSPSELPRTSCPRRSAGSPSPHHSSIVKAPRPDRRSPDSAARTISIRPALSERQAPFELPSIVPRGQKTQAPSGDLGVSALSPCGLCAARACWNLACCSPGSLLLRAVPRPAARTFSRPPSRRPVLAAPLW